jgi:hypothetical protein
MDWVVKIPWGNLEFWGLATMWAIWILSIFYKLYRRWRDIRIAMAVDDKAKTKLFEKGDMVMLKENNPFKGTLTCGKVYRIHTEHYNYIKLENTDNGTMGYFEKEYFEKATYDPNPPGAIEYDEIMEMQELSERALARPSEEETMENGGIPDCQHRGETNCQKKSDWSTHG